MSGVVQRLWRALRSATPDTPDWQPTHQHRKGGRYRVTGTAVLEADRSDVVIYDDAEGNVWVRDAAEFHDGRFRPL